MHTLPDRRLLDLWERGARRHPLDRALLLLAAATPDEPLDALADVPVAERDRALLALRRAMFGPTLPSCVDCPACGTRLEFALDTDALVLPPQPATIEVRGRRVRPPTSRDVAAALREPDGESAARCLARRCVIDAAADAAPAGAEPLDAADVDAVQEALAAADAAGDVELDLACVACAHTWRESFDVAGYLWQEVDARARELLRDVDALARVYGWTEPDVFALSDVRRRTYVEMVLA
jgi:hypothetical protein